MEKLVFEKFCFCLFVLTTLLISCTSNYEKKLENTKELSREELVSIGYKYLQNKDFQNLTPGKIIKINATIIKIDSNTQISFLLTPFFRMNSSEIGDICEYRAKSGENYNSCLKWFTDETVTPKLVCPINFESNSRGFGRCFNSYLKDLPSEIQRKIGNLDENASWDIREMEIFEIEYLTLNHQGLGCYIYKINVYINETGYLLTHSDNWICKD